MIRRFIQESRTHRFGRRIEAADADVHGRRRSKKTVGWQQYEVEPRDQSRARGAV